MKDMKATEFRVGNWIHEFGIPKQVTPLMIVGLSQIERAGKICIDLTPIPLTEEWLLKFGFESNEWKQYLKFPIFVNMGNRDIVSILASNDGSYIPSQKPCFYVHQLQNLYWCLCGNELNLK